VCVPLAEGVCVPLAEGVCVSVHLWQKGFESDQTLNHKMVVSISEVVGYRHGTCVVWHEPAVEYRWQMASCTSTHAHTRTHARARTHTHTRREAVTRSRHKPINVCLEINVCL